jgi:hypothetical protein
MKTLAYRTITDLIRTISMRSYVPRPLRSRLRGRATMVGLGLLFGVALSADAQAQREFNAVIDNVNNVAHPTAQIDVSIYHATPLAEIVFSVFRASDGMNLSSFVLNPNANGFCSSSSAEAPNDNLFTVSGGLPALVRVFITPSELAATAVVRQDLGGSKIVFGMPARSSNFGTPLAGGTEMAIAVGDLENGTSLFIANISSGPFPAPISDAHEEVTVSVGGSLYMNKLRANTVWRLDLQSVDANSNLLVRSSGAVTVEFVVNQGKSNISEIVLLATRLN